LSPAVHGGPQWSRSPPAAQRGPHAGGGGCLKEVVTPWRAHAGAGCWQNLRPHGGPTLEQSVPKGLRPVGRDPRWSSSRRTAARGKDSYWNSLWRTVSRGRDPTLEEVEKIGSEVKPGKEGGVEGRHS